MRYMGICSALQSGYVSTYIGDGTLLLRKVVCEDSVPGPSKSTKRMGVGIAEALGGITGTPPT